MNALRCIGFADVVGMIHAAHTPGTDCIIIEQHGMCAQYNQYVAILRVRYIMLNAYRYRVFKGC
jgi:hypothetical protein